MQQYPQVSDSGRPFLAFRYAAFDVDGTLLDPAGGITAGLVDGLRRLRHLGLLLMIATGRSAPGFRHAGIPPEVLDLFNHRVLVDDGDSVLDRRSGNVHGLCSLPSGAVEQLRVSSPDMVVGAHGRLYASGRRAAAAYAMAYRLPRDEIDLGDCAGPATRVTVFGGVPVAIPGATARTIGPFGATVYAPAAGGKAAGTSALLAEQFGESGLSSVIAFGDSDNDADLLTACGAGVAVSASSPAAQAAASHHIRQSLGSFLLTADLSRILGS